MCTVIHFQLQRLFKGKMIKRNCKLRKRTKERAFTVYFSGLYVHSLELLKKTKINGLHHMGSKISVIFWLKAACFMLYVDNITKHT